MDLCELIGGKKHCPDYEPQKKRKNEQRQDDRMDR